MFHRLRPQGSEIGECLTDCDPKARKSANASQIATPRLGNLRKFRRLLPQGLKIYDCFADCDPKGRKSGGLTASLIHWPTSEKFKRKPCVREASNRERHCRHVLQGSRNVSKRCQSEGEIIRNRKHTCSNEGVNEERTQTHTRALLQ